MLRYQIARSRLKTFPIPPLAASRVQADNHHGIRKRHGNKGKDLMCTAVKYAIKKEFVKSLAIQPDQDLSTARLTAATISS